jgi:hypothetical protein
VTAVDTTDGEDESPGAGILPVFHHKPAFVAKAMVSLPKQVRLILTQPVSDDLHPPGSVEFFARSGGRLTVSSIQVSGDSALLVSTLQEIPRDTIDIRLTSLFRDRFGAPPDQAHVTSVVASEQPARERFVATDAQPLPSHRIRISFNQRLRQSDGTDPTNYVVDPPGTITNVALSEDGTMATLSLTDSYPLGPYGYKYTVTIANLVSERGTPIDTGAGSQVGFVIEAESLDSITVFPHPFSPGAGRDVTFAGLPAGAFIHVYSQSGQPVVRLGPSDASGGIRWDGVTGDNRTVRPGVYLFTVEAPETGQESVLRKLAVGE